MDHHTIQDENAISGRVLNTFDKEKLVNAEAQQQQQRPVLSEVSQRTANTTHRPALAGLSGLGGAKPLAAPGAYAAYGTRGAAAAAAALPLRHIQQPPRGWSYGSNRSQYASTVPVAPLTGAPLGSSGVPAPTAAANAEPAFLTRHEAMRRLELARQRQQEAARELLAAEEAYMQMGQEDVDMDTSSSRKRIRNDAASVSFDEQGHAKRIQMSEAGTETMAVPVPVPVAASAGNANDSSMVTAASDMSPMNENNPSSSDVDMASASSASSSKTHDSIEKWMNDPARSKAEIHAAKASGIPAELPAEPLEDLDAGDEDDALMLHTYVHDIYDYMQKLELKTLPPGDYMNAQQQLNWTLRGTLMDWIVELHNRLRMLPETFFLAVHIIDRFLSTRIIGPAKLQLVGVTALLIAAKYEEIICPNIQSFLLCFGERRYSAQDLLRAERYVLRTINFDLSYPSPIHFLRRISKADGYEVHSRTVAKFFLEMASFDHRFVGVPPSLVAAASCYCARLVLNRGPWDQNLVYYSGYSEAQVLPTAQLCLNYVLRYAHLSDDRARALRAHPSFAHVCFDPTRHEHPNFIKKYATKKFHRASIEVREWVELNFDHAISLSQAWY